MIRNIRIVVSVIILFAIQLSAQNSDAMKLLEKVKKNFAKVKDYSVQVKVKIDVDFLKVPETDAELLFLAPDKVKINSEGFAMLPKQGLNFSPMSLLKSEYAAFFERNEIFENHECLVVKVVPMGNSSDVLLSTLWIDKSSDIIRKVESTTRNSGTINIILGYSDEMIKNYPLPSEMRFQFDINKSNIPKSFTGAQDDDRKPAKKGKLTKGSVYIQYSQYKINTGKIKID